MKLKQFLKEIKEAWREVDQLEVNTIDKLRALADELERKAK